MKSFRARWLSTRTLLCVGAALLALQAAFPFFWMVSTSFKPPAEVFAHLSKADELTFLIPSIYQLCHTLRLEGWEIPETTLQVEEALPILDRLLKRKIVSCGSKPQN